MSDNGGRLRGRAYSTKVGDDSAIEIVRLRWRLKIRENIVARLMAENERLRNGAAASCETVAFDESSTPHVHATPGDGSVQEGCTLTDAERAAVLAAADLLIGSKPGAILRNLLARLS